MPVTAQAITFIEQNWPGLKAYGYRAQGSVPNSLHPLGLAADVMTRNVAMGDQVASWFVNHPDIFGVVEVIWQRRIWTPDRGWHDYNGPSPHTDHVHVGFSRGSAISSIPGSIASKAGDLLGVGQLVRGAQNIAVQVAFGALALGLVALGAWRGFGGKRTRAA